MRTNQLDLSTMVARILLALLVAATVVLLGLWLRASDALGFVSTLLAVSTSQLVLTSMRGDRVGPPTAAARRLQPLIDAVAEYPGGKLLGTRSFKRGVVALGVGFVVALGSSALAALLFEHAVMAPLWRGTVALAIVLLPVNLFLAWARSRQVYEGTVFATKMRTAMRKVINPDAGDTPGRSLPPLANTLLFGVGRTVITLTARVLVQLLIPVVFSTWVSIAAVAVGVVTWIAGAPIFSALGRSLTVPNPAPEAAGKEGRV